MVVHIRDPLNMALLDISKPFFFTLTPFHVLSLAIFIIGDATKNDALETIHAMDEIFMNYIREANLYDKIWQAYAMHLHIKTMGVQDDQRTCLIPSLYKQSLVKMRCLRTRTILIGSSLQLSHL